MVDIAITQRSRFFPHERRQGGGGDSNMEQIGMLVGNFEINP